MSEHTCGACRLWDGRCIAGNDFQIYETGKSCPMEDYVCPAFQSRSAAANQAKFIEAVKGLVELNRSIYSDIDNGTAEGIPTSAENWDAWEDALAAVEAAMKEME